VTGSNYCIRDVIDLKQNLISISLKTFTTKIAQSQSPEVNLVTVVEEANAGITMEAGIRYFESQVG
jgi:hypothetical protein